MKWPYSLTVYSAVDGDPIYQDDYAEHDMADFSARNRSKPAETDRAEMTYNGVTTVYRDGEPAGLFIRITPDPEVRAAVLRAAGLEDLSQEDHES